MSEITRSLPQDRSGGTEALASLGQALQTNFLVPGNLGLLILLFIDFVVNVMEVAVQSPTKAKKRVTAALWARCVDWAAAAAATLAMIDYLSLVITIPNLVRVAFIDQVNVKMGMAATALHVSVAGVSMLAAVIKTFLGSDEMQLKEKIRAPKIIEKGSGRMPPRRPSPVGREAFSTPAPYETRFSRGYRMTRYMSRFYGR